MHRKIQGTPKACVVIRDIDQWYACIFTELEQGGAENHRGEPNKPTVGVDLGISNIATLSDRTTLPSPRYVLKSIQQIKGLRRPRMRETCLDLRSSAR